MTMKFSPLVIQPFLMILLLAFFFLIAVSPCSVASDDEVQFVPSKNNKANWRYYYSHAAITSNQIPSATSSCCGTVIVSGVGTAMAVSDYHRLAQKVVSTNRADVDYTGNDGVVFVVLDAASYNPDKSVAQEFADAVISIQNEINQKLPQCCDGADLPQRWILGGHSSSGQAAAVAIYEGLVSGNVVDGFLGLAPFLKTIPSHTVIPVPSLSWGFTVESCMVSPSLAALRSYDISSSTSRILFQVETDNKDIVFTGGHCTFTDKGCKHMCIGDLSTTDMTDMMHIWVAESIQVFIESIKSNSYTKSSYERVVRQANSDDRQVNIVVNQEELMPNPKYYLKGNIKEDFVPQAEK